MAQPPLLDIEYNSACPLLFLPLMGQFAESFHKKKLPLKGSFRQKK
jgi:hypothetical protein